VPHLLIILFPAFFNFRRVPQSLTPGTRGFLFLARGGRKYFASLCFGGRRPLPRMAKPRGNLWYSLIWITLLVAQHRVQKIIEITTISQSRWQNRQNILAAKKIRNSNLLLGALKVVKTVERFEEFLSWL